MYRVRLSAPLNCSLRSRSALLAIFIWCRRGPPPPLWQPATNTEIDSKHHRSKLKPHLPHGGFDRMEKEVSPSYASPKPSPRICNHASCPSRFDHFLVCAKTREGMRTFLYGHTTRPPSCVFLYLEVLFMDPSSNLALSLARQGGQCRPATPAPEVWRLLLLCV